MGKNEVVTVENKSKRGFWFRNNKSEVMVSEEVCVDIANLGYQLVSVAGTVAVKYLDKKMNAYHECVDANIKNNELLSNEKIQLIKAMESITEKYVNIIKDVDDSKKREDIQHMYESYIHEQVRLYNKYSDEGNINVPAFDNTLPKNNRPEWVNNLLAILGK